MNTLRRVLEILNPQNKHILLDNDLADLLEIKRRRSRTTINNLMSRHQNNQTVNEVKVNYISICRNTFNFTRNVYLFKQYSSNYYQCCLDSSK